VSHQGRRSLTGWGRTAPTSATVRTVRDVDDVLAAVRGAAGRGVLARGLGRSYGDAAQNAGGVVLDMTGLDQIHSIDAAAATADVAGGVSLDALMRAALPRGLWLPVLPGTRQVTIGGAIAADVHGKAHHVAGSFGDHVVWLDLLTADGVVRRVGPDGPESELFWATVGGMGLTGIVVRATVQLRRVETAYFRADIVQADTLEELMRTQAERDRDYDESVAWFDTTVAGRHLGRGTLSLGNHARLEELPARLRRSPLRFDAPRLPTLPDVFPSGLLNRLTARAFNEVWWRKSPTRSGVVQNITQFLHPLDVLGEWNRLYGRAGFVQYQYVVPPERGDAVRASVALIAASGQVSALNVLKRFGPGNAGMLSFPREGWTLAVDLPVRPGLERLCRELDRLVLDAGGRVYLAKDSRLDPHTFAAMYPRLAEFRAIREKVDPEGVFRSDLARRLGI
jgi:decaprenylphospho-beta-D-ribofuranose 2-oxidase